MSINYLSFNDTVSHLVCSTSNGFIIYALSPSIQKKVIEDKKGAIGIMKILKRTNICAFSGTNVSSFTYNSITTTKNTVILWDNHEQKTIIQVDCGENIKNISIITDIMLVILEYKILVITFDGKTLNAKTTYSNPNGICEIVGDSEPTIATLGNHKGEICIWKLHIDTNKIIQAHDGNIECLALNRSGNLVASASERGTLIRIFNCQTGRQIYEFRRGTNPTQIFSIAFSWDDKYLVCSSGNGTVHIYELYEENTVSNKNTQSMFFGFKDYLPAWVSSEWSYKQHYLNTYAKSLCSFDETGAIHIVTYDGKYFKISGKSFDMFSTTDMLINSK
jgi:WD40 repeat protein